MRAPEERAVRSLHGGRTLGVCGVALAALAATARPAEAQDRCSTGGEGGSCSVEVWVRRTPATVVFLVVSQQSVTLPSPLVGQGKVLPQTGAGLVARVFSNAPWQLQLSAATPFWQGSGGAGARKSASDLGWGVGAAGPFTPLSVQPAAVAFGGASRGTAIPLYFQVGFDAATDLPGDYSLDLVLTLSAP